MGDQEIVEPEGAQAAFVIASERPGFWAGVVHRVDAHFMLLQTQRVDETFAADAALKPVGIRVPQPVAP